MVVYLWMTICSLQEAHARFFKIFAIYTYRGQTLAYMELTVYNQTWLKNYQMTHLFMTPLKLPTIGKKCRGCLVTVHSFTQ